MPIPGRKLLLSAEIGEFESGGPGEFAVGSSRGAAWSGIAGGLEKEAAFDVKISGINSGRTVGISAGTESEVCFSGAP